jgi:hypothetical protein
MRSVTRRELSHDSARILDYVLATGEPVEVITRGRQSVVIAPKPESLYEQWRAQGLVKPATGSLLGLPRAHSPRTVAEILADVSSDH